MKKKLLFLFLMIMTIAGCGMFSTGDRVAVNLPNPPDSWIERFGQISFTIRYLSENDEIGCIESGPGIRQTFITVPKKVNSPVLAIPHAGNIQFYPAGGVFPSGLNSENELTLTWEDGFLTEILVKLAFAGTNLASINVKKLKTEIDKRSDGDPWRLDGAQIAARLSTGEFSIYFIDEKPSLDVVIEPAQGEWFSENPLASVITADENNRLSIGSLSFGFHRFFRQGTEDILDIFADESGWALISK